MKRILGLIALLLLIFSPRILWGIHPATDLDIAIIDKTVPKTDYREHHGLFWALENEKIVNNRDETYDIGRDYFGYDPYDQKPFPPFDERGPFDLIYIADTYGVYSNDLKEKPDGERSKLVYGGMDLLEWNQMMNSRDSESTLIAEFNSFAAPTDSVTRSVMEKNINVEWTGWTGRFFSDLNSEEIPPWLIRNYEKQYKKKWVFNGPGIAFVHLSDQVVVLGNQKERPFVQFQLTKEGKRHYPHVGSSHYMYWFDIIKPKNGAIVEAEYDLHLSQKEKEQLKKAKIPTTFPAITHHQQEKTYYFAGDYADFPKQPLAKWRGSSYLFWLLSDDESEFYWHSYVPLMRQILTEIAEEKIQ
ncbi:hypothetical protein [Bacillus sp. REN10]|uniref:hypothetical protein n=1 Tax=Bacillus sp. REN10 TaxID=2782541 RepID=UPI00193C10AA|nr:hypothetical protein [Bacillus sp. REN10]